MAEDQGIKQVREKEQLQHKEDVPLLSCEGRQRKNESPSLEAAIVARLESCLHVETVIDEA